MEIQNINTLLKNEETRELGAMMVVSQGLEKKFLAFYEIKRKRNKYYKVPVFSKLGFFNGKQIPLRCIRKAIIKAVRRQKKGRRLVHYLNILSFIRNAMHDKEVEELVQAGKMKESDRLPF